MLILQDGSLDLNAAESGVQHKPSQATSKPRIDKNINKKCGTKI